MRALTSCAASCVQKPDRARAPGALLQLLETQAWLEAGASLADGVVSWRCSVEREQPEVENIEVDSSHFGIGAHPLVLYAVPDRLALREGQWTPFLREGWKAFAYGDPRRSPSSGR